MIIGTILTAWQAVLHYEYKIPSSIIFSLVLMDPCGLFIRSRVCCVSLWLKIIINNSVKVPFQIAVSVQQLCTDIVALRDEASI